MRNDELERRIQRNVRNLTHKDMCQLSAYLKVQSSNRKQATQDAILDHMKNLNHDDLLNMSKYIDDLFRSNSSKPRQTSSQRTPDAYSFSTELTSSILKSAPIDLESEIQYDLRSDLVVSNLSYSHQLFAVPIQMITSASDRGSNLKIPNILQNVQIMTSPFYCCSICLHPLTFLAPKIYPNIAQANARNNTKANFNLILTENIRKIIERNQFRIHSKNDYKWQILIRFVGIEPGQKIPCNGDKVTEMIPPYLTVQINKTQQALWDILPSNCRTKEGKRHPKPVNVSEKISFSRMTDTGYPQELEITWWQVPGLFTYYYMGIYLERKLTVNEMITLFTSNRHVNNIPLEDIHHFIESKLVHASRQTYHNSVDDDEDIVMANVLPIYLLCPVGKSRIEIPIRTITCQHLQCFDAHLFLSMNERRSVWKCPVCDNQATPNDLFCDKYFAKVLNHFKDDSDITEVHVLPDKSFIAITNKNKTEKEQVVESSTKIPTKEVSDMSLIVLDSDDEDDGSSSKKGSKTITVPAQTPTPPPPVKVPEPAPVPLESPLQDPRWKATNTPSRPVQVAIQPIITDTINSLRSMHQTDPRIISSPSTTTGGVVPTTTSSIPSVARSTFSIPTSVLGTPVSRPSTIIPTISPSSPIRLPVPTPIIIPDSTNRTLESTTISGTVSSVIAAPKIVHTTVPSHVGAPISVINGKNGHNISASITKLPATPTTSASSPYSSKKTVLSYSDLLVPDKIQKSTVDKSSSLLSTSTTSSKELPVSTVTSTLATSGTNATAVSSTQHSSRVVNTVRFNPPPDISTTGKSGDNSPNHNIVRQRNSVATINNSFDTAIRSTFGDVVRTPSVTMSPVPKKGTRQSENASPEPVVCPSFIIQSPTEVDNHRETPPLLAAPSTLSTDVPGFARTANESSTKKSKITQSKIPPPPAASVVIPPVTIDLTEEDDELQPVPAPVKNFDNRMRFGNKDVKWISINGPITSRTAPGAPLHAVNGMSSNRYSRDHGSSGGAHKRQLGNSGVNYFMPHQNRTNKTAPSQSQQQQQSVQAGPAIDLTGDDEDSHLPAKKMRGARSDDNEDGQVDSSDDADTDDNNRHNSTVSMVLQPLKHMTKKNVSASRI